MKKRLAFKCWNCHMEYTLFQEITTQQELIVPCPFCNAEALVKLEPFKPKKKTVLRGAGEQDSALGFEYDFPDLIPTQKPD